MERTVECEWCEGTGIYQWVDGEDGRSCECEYCDAVGVITADDEEEAP